MCKKHDTLRDVIGQHTYIYIYATNTKKYITTLEPHTGNIHVLIYCVGVQSRNEFILCLSVFTSISL